MNVKIVIKSQLCEVEKVYQWLEGYLLPLLKNKRLEEILLVMQEIVTNAVIHGNYNHFNKKVCIYLEVAKNQIILMVEDEGEGIKSLVEAQNMDYMEENGRGLKLAVLISDRIELNHNSIRLWFSFT
ncbi:MAG TPA: hypothetical protein EYG67_01855 [Campylobacterales bacterium]|nr:hypothetical protein [Campylobacterales bacterium]HIP41939.1 hypothetical protein [Campylobacterales bacterium]